MLEDVSLGQFVAQHLRSGKYQSYEEMVQAGLRLLQAYEAELDRIADKLRPAVEEFLSGHPSVPLMPQESLNEVRSVLRQTSGIHDPQCTPYHLWPWKEDRPTMPRSPLRTKGGYHG